jgi:AcrR family transcriptional regulator
MSRTVGSHGPRTAEAIMKAGLELIYEHGYEAVSLRQLAQAVGIQSGSLYNHIRSKQELLVTLVVRHLGHLLESADEALSGIGDPKAALRAFIAFHMSYHMSRKREIYIANSELRSLEPDNRKRVVELRRTYERKLIGILDRLVDEQGLEIRDTRVTAYAIIAMLTGVANWYRSDGPLEPADLVDMHTDLILNGLLNLSAQPAKARPGPKRRTKPVAGAR